MKIKQYLLEELVRRICQVQAAIISDRRAFILALISQDWRTAEYLLRSFQFYLRQLMVLCNEIKMINRIKQPE